MSADPKQPSQREAIEKLRKLNPIWSFDELCDVLLEMDQRVAKLEREKVKRPLQSLDKL